MDAMARMRNSPTPRTTPRTIFPVSESPPLVVLRIEYVVPLVKGTAVLGDATGVVVLAVMAVAAPLVLVGVFSAGGVVELVLAGDLLLEVLITVCALVVLPAVGAVLLGRLAVGLISTDVAVVLVVVVDILVVLTAGVLPTVVPVAVVLAAVLTAGVLPTIVPVTVVLDGVLNAGVLPTIVLVTVVTVKAVRIAPVVVLAAGVADTIVVLSEGVLVAGGVVVLTV